MFIVFALVLIMGACLAVRLIDAENTQLRTYAATLEAENDALRTQITTDHKPYALPFNVIDISA